MRRITVRNQEVVVYPDGRLDTKNASTYTGSAIKTMDMGRCNGTGPKYVKLGGRVFYFINDLDDWINKGGRLTSTAQEKADADHVITARKRPSQTSPDHWRPQSITAGTGNPSRIKSKRGTGVKSGQYPSPVKTLGRRVTALDVDSIRQLKERNSSEEVLK